MRLTHVETTTVGDRIRLLGQVERSAAGSRQEVWFEFPKRCESFVSASADPFAIGLLAPAMDAGEPLEIVPPISESLHFQLPGIRDVFHTWWQPRFKRVPIVATARPASAPARRPQAATFFSGGVDSFYTLLKRLDHEPLPAPLTHLIFMHGVEQMLGIAEGAQSSQQRAERIALAVGIECLVGATNLRTLYGHRLHWERYYFGSVLAAIATALSEGFGYVCIPSSFTYLHQVPHGSSPLVDERFSTEAVRIVHDGSEASRATKTACIVEWNERLVLENLRVCYMNRGGDYNCCRCYKCVRTAVALKAIGAWERAAAFPHKSSSHWGKVLSSDHVVLTEENLALARARGADRELVSLLERAVRAAKRHESFVKLVENSPIGSVFEGARQWLWQRSSAHKAGPH